MNLANMLARFIDQDGDFDYAAASDENRQDAVALLSPSGLADALRAVRGCGCCVNGPEINFRSEIFDRVLNILEDRV